MKRLLSGTLMFAGLIACDDPTRPVDRTGRVPERRGRHCRPPVHPPESRHAGRHVSAANGINELGEVAGFSDLPSGEVRAFLWRPGKGMRSLGSLGGTISRARSVNDRSEVVGFSQIRTGSD